MAIFIDDKTELGKIILLKLRDLNKSQKWLSERTGYSYIHIHSIISGKMNPSIKCLHEISKALNIPIGELAEAIEKEEKSGGNLVKN